jgi:hypothetical protein
MHAALTEAEIIDADLWRDSIEPTNEGEPTVWLVLKQSEAVKIVSAAEKGRAYSVVDVLKNQPWWPELSAAVRGLRYLEAGSRDPIVREKDGSTRFILAMETIELANIHNSLRAELERRAEHALKYRVPAARRQMNPTPDNCVCG